MISYHTHVAELVRSGMNSKRNGSQQSTLAEKAEGILVLLGRV